MPTDPLPTMQPNGPVPIRQNTQQLQQDLEHITQEMYRQNKELADTNRTLSLLRAIDAIVLAPHTSIKQVCRDIAQAIASATDYNAVGILLQSPHAEGHLALYGWSIQGNPAADELLSRMRPLHVSLDHSWFADAEAHRLLSLEDVPEVAVLAATDCTPGRWRHLKRVAEVRSLYIIKLMVRHHLVGLLVVGMPDARPELSAGMVTLFERVSESVGVALDNKLLFEENRSVLRQLRISNTRLKMLDETKDDFISMASHQLRTPLTAVKGYLSMVLDGDAGKLTPVQVQMLQQAFSSSQRMVYLITDLLNVSRLKTGKFLIDAQPTDLAEVVKQEVDQLQETAEAKQISLTFEHPPAFPQLMLDEVKIRQVIMNFIDNAIYYTPEGGRIKVQLLERAETVELRVTDSGIGVPRSEQHHLFTKFYRASNARKARPDGTGLGLFMAQKVIIAQGGSILFSSREHHGSTFGFVFSKARVGVPPTVAAS